MLGFFESFNKGCGCALGVVAGLVIAAIILTLLFSVCEVEVVNGSWHTVHGRPVQE